MKLAKILRRQNIVIASLALITALTLSSTVVAKSIYNNQRKIKLAQNCAVVNFPPNAAKNTILDPQNGTLLVKWYNNDQESSIELPYEPVNGFEGCSASAKEILQHAKGAYDEQMSESCTDFRDILSGKKPILEKNGQKPNINGAITFVKEYCK